MDHFNDLRIKNEIKVTPKVFSELNKEQLEAVTSTEGYIRVIAGAGSGKTKALAARYVYLVKELSISPSSILCVTFTNKAAAEMKKRIRRFIGDDCAYICTFHGFCVKLLHEEIHRVNYPKQFSIMDTEDQKDVLLRCFEQFGIELNSYKVKDALEIIREYKEGNIDRYIPLVTAPDETPLIMALGAAKNIEEAIIYTYLIEQRKSYALDFNDLIFFTLYILNTNETARIKWQKRLEYVMVDEFQDVSINQYKLVSILSNFHKNLFVVGDPDQTIYTWRGANPTFILNFDKVFPSTKTIFLEKNYRSNGDILSAANSLIKKNKERIDKNLIPTKSNSGKPIFLYAQDQVSAVKWMINQISLLIESNIKLSDICILYRSHFLSRPIEEQLLSTKIPYKIYDGIAFYQRKEIKDIHSYMRFLILHDDLSFRRIANTPTRGIGKKSMQCLENISQDNQCSLYEALLEVIKNPDLGTKSLKANKNKIQKFINFVKKYSSSIENYGLSSIMQEILRESGYEEMLQTNGDDSRLDNLAELKQAIMQYETEIGEEVSLQDYLEHIALFSSGDESDTESLKIMTVHSAKGLEFPYVFIFELSEGIFPTSRANTMAKMEEERRLAYVAFTRAEKQLFLISSSGNNFNNQFRFPSRFIFNAEKVNLDYVFNLPEEIMEDATNYIIADEKNLILSGNTISIGTKVHHPAFGNGTIIKSDPINKTYIIKFDNVETERTLSMDANLTLL